MLQLSQWIHWNHFFLLLQDFFSLSPLINYDDKTALEHPQNKDKQCVLSEAGDVRSIEDALPSLWHICFLLQTVKGKKKEAQ